MAVEIDFDYNVIKIYRDDKTLPELNYIDSKGISWQKDTYGNVEIIKLVSKKTGNEILLNSIFLTTILEDLRQDLKHIEKEILWTELDIGSYMKESTTDFPPPPLEKGKNLENYLKALQGWGGRAVDAGGSLGLDDYESNFLINWNFYYSFEELPTSLKRINREIFETRIIRLTGIESSSDLYVYNEVSKAHEKVIFGKLALQKAIEFAKHTVINCEQFILERQKIKFIEKQDF